MKRLLLLFFISLGVVILQQSIFSRILLFGVAFDVVYVYIVCFAILRDDVESVGVALFTGILRDAFFPGIFGVNTIIYLLTAYSIGYIQKRIYKDSKIIPLFFTFAATAFKGIMYFSYFYIVSYKYDFKRQMLGIILLECLYNSILSLYIFKLVNRLDSIKVLKQEWKF